MVKNNTLVVLVCAVILAGAVYYFDFRHPKDDDAAPKDTSKPALSLQASDVTGIMLSHPGQASTPGGVPAIDFEKRGGNWQITRPVDTAADQPTLQGLVDLIAGARVDQTEPGTPDRLKVYGLDPPRTAVELRLANGSKHTLLFGDKDFTGASVYAVIDGGRNVSLLPAALFESVTKPLDDLRDRAVLHLDPAATASFDLKNSSGELAAFKTKEGDKDSWKFTKPDGSSADADAVSSLLGGIATVKFTGVAAETADNLAKYGLASPAMSFTAVDDKGTKAALAIGKAVDKKDGEGYFARDASRPTIFRIDADLYAKLAAKYADLRDKQVVHLNTSDIRGIDLHNDKGDLALSRKKDAPDEWDIDAPTDAKGKTAAAWKILDPLTGLRADEVLDHPDAGLAAQLAKPAVTVMLTEQSGKQLTVRISKTDGDFVYVQAGAAPTLYKVKKQAVDDLNLTAADVAL
jgi:Domain of unknown function (DUF4340)